MTEVKNSSVDLLSRQMTGSRKKEDKTVNSLSEFKAMLKSGNQKKDGKSPESGDSSDDKLSASEAASEAAALVAAAGMAVIQEPEEQFQMAGQDPMKQIMETVGAAEAPVLEPEEDGKIQTMDLFRTLDRFRFHQLAEKSMGTESLADGNLETLADNSKEIAKPLFQEAMMQKTGEKKPVIQDNAVQNPETTISSKGEMDTLPLQQLLKAAETVSDSPKEEPAVNLHRSNSLEKPTHGEEDQEKVQENHPEKPYEPVRFWNNSTTKPEEVHMSVSADNSKELEAKLSEQILKQIREGNGELDIQLEPHNLGKIRIRVTYEDNQISVSLLCTESRTLKLLSQSAGDLGSILESNLERPFQVLVDKQEPDYLNQQQEQGSRQEQRGQHQESQREENSGDFIQKLRLGIFESESADGNDVGYR